MLNFSLITWVGCQRLQVVAFSAWNTLPNEIKGLSSFIATYEWDWISISKPLTNWLLLLLLLFENGIFHHVRCLLRSCQLSERRLNSNPDCEHSHLDLDPRACFYLMSLLPVANGMIEPVSLNTHTHFAPLFLPSEIKECSPLMQSADQLLSLPCHSHMPAN